MVPPKSNPAPKSHSQSRLDPLASISAQQTKSLGPILSLKLLFCQLPLPTFFYQPKDALLVIRFHGIRSLRRKENSSQGSCQCLPVQLRYHKSCPKGPEYPRSCSGILTPFLFNKWPIIVHFEMEFPFLLGSTNLCPTAVHVEPFSTSFFKVLIWICGTTTNICTRGRFTQAHAKGFHQDPHALVLVRALLFTLTAEDRHNAWAPSILGASWFGRSVVTHSLLGSNFHGHHPAL